LICSGSGGGHAKDRQRSSSSGVAVQKCISDDRAAINLHAGVVG
jgi:hypothetical protein